MGKLITTEIAVAYTNCPRKAFLLLETGSPPPLHDYEAVCRARGETHRERYLAQLRRDAPEAVGYDQDGLGVGHRYLVGVDLRAGDLSASSDLLVRTDQRPPSGGHSYCPQLIVGTYSVTDDQRFALSFVGRVLGLIGENPPDHGTVVTLDGVAHKVALAGDNPEVTSVLEEVQGMFGQDASKAPPVILNRHCPLCPFRSECRSKAEDSDDLSLLDRMTPKAIRRYHKKGIFTVNQLSYLFRPRRNRKRAKAKPTFNLELQALAIRTGKIYLQALPGLVRPPVTIFLDIEGIPDEQYHYLIGLLVCRGEVRTSHSFWADALEDEPRVWESLRLVLDANPDATIVHYGSYESKAIARMGQRYDTDVEPYLRRMVNLNEVIYGRVYFPVRSNSLKVIGGFLGATWSEPDASGLQSLVWRYRWEESRDDGLKAKLSRYNQDDCLALQLLWDELLRIKESADSNARVDFADRPKQLASEIGSQVHARFEEILRFAHSDYQKNHIFVRSEDTHPGGRSGRQKGGQKGHPKYQRILPTRADRVVVVPRKRICSVEGERLQPSDQFAERYQIDLRFTKKGCKKIVTRYTGRKAFCPKCRHVYLPPALARLEGRLFGHGFQAWTVYQRIVLRLPYRVITAVMEDMFGERTSEGTVVNFMQNLAAHYGPCEEINIGRMLKGPFIHVDETRLNIQGTDHYVWVFTDGRRVFFRITETRETTLVHEMLKDYRGILISDFYPGYDSVVCRQQKCLVHLIRDLNDDLWNSPFNAEYEGFVVAVKDLLVPIIAAVHRHGLKTRYLSKFMASVDEFYRRYIIERTYKFEVTQKYRKRFERYRDSLFTFLELDGIPWNNNTAERGIRHLAVQRLISGSFFKAAVPNYLLLLGISQTCRFQNKSFLKFMISEGLDVDAFKSGKRLRISKPVGKPHPMGGDDEANSTGVPHSSIE